MIGDPILMFGLGLGIDGAGLSTAISQYISFGILLYMVFSKRTISRLSLRYRSNDPDVTLSIMRVGAEHYEGGLPQPDPADAQQPCDHHTQSLCNALR